MVESKELEEFVRSAFNGIRKGVPEDLEIKFPIEFEVAVVFEKESDEKYRLLVVNEPAEYAQQEISRIKFQIGKREVVSNRIHFFRE